MGGMAITTAGFAFAGALTATNPILGVVVGAAWIVLGNDAWKDLTSNL